MFGKRTSRRPQGTTITTTTHTTKTVPQHHHTSSTGGFMNRLRPRRNPAPTYTNGHSHGTSTASHKVSSRNARRHRREARHQQQQHHTTTVPTTTTTTGAAPVTHRRKTSVGDKMSGAMLKLKGSLTGRPGVKGAGTRRMNGTDGRGARTYY